MEVTKKNLIKYVICVCLSVFIVMSIPSKASALTVVGLYGDMVGTNSTLQNLVNYAVRYDDFYNSSYVAFRDSQYSYYLVWGDSDAFNWSNNIISASSCSFVRYYRNGTSQSYEYVYTEDDTLSLTCDYLVTTNIDGVKGFDSELIDEWNYRKNTRNVFIFYGVLFVFCSLIISVRRE